MQRLSLFGAFALLTALLAPAAHADLTVVATLPDLAALAHEVGGDRVKVTHLAAPQEDPHYVDPRPSFILAINRADVVIANGLELEASWLQPLLVQARNGKVQTGANGYIDASTVVQTIEVPAQVDRTRGDIHAGGNPHFLFDPRAAKAIVGLIGQRFAALDPPNAAQYVANAQRYQAQLQTLIDTERARFAALPAKKRQLVAYHQSLSYLFNWLTLIQIQTVEPKPGIPPNPAHTAQVLTTMKSHGTAIIVQEEYYPAKISKTLTRLVGGKFVKLSGGTRFADGERYHARIQAIAEQLYAALR